jgi:hypothetical protein
VAAKDTELAVSILDIFSTKVMEVLDLLSLTKFSPRIMKI